MNNWSFNSNALLVIDSLNK